MKKIIAKLIVFLVTSGNFREKAVMTGETYVISLLFWTLHHSFYNYGIYVYNIHNVIIHAMAYVKF